MSKLSDKLNIYIEENTNNDKIDYEEITALNLQQAKFKVSDFQTENKSNIVTLLRLENKIKSYVDKYKNLVIEAIKEMEFGSNEETVMHTKLLSKAAKGDVSARNYVINVIKRVVLQDIKIDKDDLRELREKVIAEYKILLNKSYVSYQDNEVLIDYYQLIDLYKKDNYQDFLYNLDLDSITGINEFVQMIYMETYGNSLLEPLLNLNINNIEVHGTRKIRIETSEGKWKTIKDYRFLTDEDIVKVATHIITQDDKGELTEENCVMEGTMSNGCRITIALKNASLENNIFIKKFDGFKLESINDIVRAGEITDEQLNELKIYAKGRCNLSIIGGVNSGKTTFMKAYVGLFPDEYKIGMIESDFESHLLELYPNKDIVSLASTRKFSVNDLFINMLRMNRHILSLGEARSYEVEQLIKAATRGSDGSFSTSHSRTEHDLINNMAWMALEGGLPMDIRILRYRIACAIDIVVRLWHAPSGKRYVDRISEIIPVHNNLDMPYIINPIFRYNVDTEKVEKVGNISTDLRDKFRYYNCTKDEVNNIINLTLEKEKGMIA